VKTLLVSSVREQNKTFYGMVIAQAQKIEREGDAIVFTYGPVHKHLRAQLDGKRGWLEQIAQSIAGRKVAVLTRESAPIPAAPAAADEAAAAKQASLRAQAKAQPEMQTVLDVFGGEIEDVEEMN